MTIPFARLTSSAHRFTSNQSGAAAVMVMLFLPVLIGGAGFGIDATQYVRAKTIVANATDHAALGATSTDAGSRQEMARRFFNAQVPKEWQDTVKVTQLDISASQPGSGPVRVTVKVEAKVNMAFARIFGVDTLPIEHSATAEREVKNIEAVMALPSGGTMCSSKSRKANASNVVEGDQLVQLTPDSSCAHFNAMKQGVNTFLSIAGENQAVNSIKVGLVPYNVKVNFPNKGQIPTELLNSETDKTFFTNLSEAEPLSTIQPLTTNMTHLRSVISNLKLTPEGMAWSRTDLPTMVSGMMLDPSKRNAFGGESAKPFSDTSIQKVLILMTDGANIGCCFTNWRQGNFDNQYVYQYKPYNDATISYCKMLKDNNVQIFTILFDVQEGDPGGAAISNVFARCASGVYSEPGVKEDNPSAQLRCRHRQNCYNVSTDSQLVNAYKDIAQNFFIPRLVQ